MSSSGANTRGVHAVEHEDMEMGVAVLRGAKALHEGDAAAAGVAVAQLVGPAPVAGFQVLRLRWYGGAFHDYRRIGP